MGVGSLQEAGEDGWEPGEIGTDYNTAQYHKIPIISPGLIFVQKAFLLGLFLGKLIFRGACYQKEFCISKNRCGFSMKATKNTKITA